MGDIRNPRPIYKDGVVIEFFNKNKILNFRTLVHGSDNKPFQVLTGIYNENPDKLIQRTKELAPVDHSKMGYDDTFWLGESEKESQSFSTVSRK